MNPHRPFADLGPARDHNPEGLHGWHPLVSSADRSTRLVLVVTLVLLILCILLPAVARSADDTGAGQVRRFLDRVSSLSADFRQDVLDTRGEVVESSGGTVRMQRPGRFRWDYREPFERVIVSDGDKLWLYEADLEQVTVRRLDEGIGDTPAALITGRTDVLDRFAVKRSWQREGLSWVALAPKAAESDFAEVRLGFAGDELRQLELDDRLGQQTRVRLSALQLNGALPPDTFRFTAPAGVDVIDESAL